MKRPPKAPAARWCCRRSTRSWRKSWRGSAALHELIGASGKSRPGADQPGRSCSWARNRDGEGQQRGLIALTQHFAADDLPEARTAIANRIIAEFKSAKRLCPDSLVEELRRLRRIANRVVLGHRQISQPRRPDRRLHPALQAAGDAGDAGRASWPTPRRRTKRSSGCCSSRTISSARRTSASWRTFVTAGRSRRAISKSIS